MTSSTPALQKRFAMALEAHLTQGGEAALLSAYEEVLGPEHPQTLAVWYQLAHWTALAGDEAATQD